MIIRAILLTIFQLKLILSMMEAHHPHPEDSQRQLDDTLLQIQNKLDHHSEVISQMNFQINELTLKVSDLEQTKELLHSQVQSLETQLSCVISDTCSSKKCLHRGILTQGGVCSCHKGYTGDNCERDVNECGNNPCLNDGQCENTFGSFNCHCLLNYYGPICEEKYDDCSPNPCNNGECVSLDRRKEGVAHFQCICPGWTFNVDNEACYQDINECDNMYDYCDDITVTCTNTPGSFQCTCPVGYFGSGKLSEGGCSLDAPCSSNPCHNGQCHDLEIGYNCECDKGWTGRTCNARHWCYHDPCINGGECVETGDTYTCDCKRGFEGELCELCGGEVCKGDRQCVTPDGVSFYCKCTDTSTDCQDSRIECLGNTCKNGGLCAASGNQTCTCQPGYHGDFCQDTVLYELSTCGAMGAIGPSSDECDLHYRNLNGIDVESGIQNVYISDTGVYQITVRGASGGTCEIHEQAGGYPAEISAIMTLKQGFINVAVGQEGSCYKFSDDLKGKISNSVVCGGGGGTFVVRDGSPVIIAGGGGGAGDNGPGLNASESTDGTSSYPYPNEAYEGTMGGGGRTCPDFGGAGGAGFLSSGENGFIKGNQILETGGRPWPDLRGGIGRNITGTNYGRTAFGGFGGGGRGTWSPGGGGGYSGGAGKCSRTGKGTAHKGGGGGGSLVNSDSSTSGARISSKRGPGHVKIVRLANQ